MTLPTKETHIFQQKSDSPTSKGTKRDPFDPQTQRYKGWKDMLGLNRGVEVGSRGAEWRQRDKKGMDRKEIGTMT